MTDRLFTDPSVVPAPAVMGSDTSEEAAKLIEPTSGSLRGKILEHTRRMAAFGVTDDEVEMWSGLRHQTASARRRELVQAGLLRDSGRRRPTRSGRMATVWVAT
jgi:hypothetical protein